MAITSWTATSGAWDDPLFERAWDGPAISPDKGDVTLSSSIPSFGQAFFISPAVANLEILQSYEWDQLTTSWVATPGTWTSGPVPEVGVGTGISPAKSDLTLTGSSAPVPGVSYDFKSITAGTITSTTYAPALGEGLHVTVDNADLQFVQTYSWNTYGGTWANAYSNWNTVAFAPDAVEEGKNQPAVGTLTITGQIPTFTKQQLWYIPTADLTLSVSTPSHGMGYVIGSASLTGLGTTSWADTSGDWASSSDTWGTGTLFPTVGITYTFPIDSSDLELTTDSPQYPYIGDPKYIPQVTLL